MKLQLCLVLVLCGQALGDCYVGGLRCCITEFLNVVSVYEGFDITEARLNRTCMTIDASFECLNDYEELCVHKNEELENAIGSSKSVMTDLCSSNSDLRVAVMKNQACLANAASELKSCASEAVPEVSEKKKTEEEFLKNECCEYKKLKECAITLSKSKCGSDSHIDQHIENIANNVTGLGYMQACKDYWSDCNSAISLLSPVWLLVVGFYSSMLSA